ncbi:MAG: hypothetical protein L6Q60_02365 [Rhodocyclaceae bacterium]|nr:hypothetical protein [Rhodocyclaceae bacterium]
MAFVMHDNAGSSGRGWLMAAALFLAAQLALVWFLVEQRGGRMAPPMAGGTLVAVTLTGGGVFYGKLGEAPAGYLRLSGVHYVETVTMPNGQRDNRLINRQRNDWHAPESMTIPLERVQFIETVGSNSQLAGLIAQGNAKPAQ